LIVPWPAAEPFGATYQVSPAVVFGAEMVRAVETASPVNRAEIRALVAVETNCVLTVKVADLLPAATTTLPGTSALTVSLVSVTLAPPAGAGPFKVTLPVDAPPPVTRFGTSVTPVTVIVGAGVAAMVSAARAVLRV
jgi:hypothetical protein